MRPVTTTRPRTKVGPAHPPDARTHTHPLSLSPLPRARVAGKLLRACDRGPGEGRDGAGSSLLLCVSWDGGGGGTGKVGPGILGGKTNKKRTWDGGLQPACPAARPGPGVWVLTCWHFGRFMALCKGIAHQGKSVFQEPGAASRQEAGGPGLLRDPGPGHLRLGGFGAEGAARTSGCKLAWGPGVGTVLSGCFPWKPKERKSPNPNPTVDSFKSPV